MLSLPLLVLREVGVSGEFLVFWSDMDGMWESKAKYPTPILSVISAILVFRGGMFFVSM